MVSAARRHEAPANERYPLAVMNGASVLGRVGVSLRPLAFLPHMEAVQLARHAEELGFGAVWFPESVPGKEAFSLSAALLAATDRITVATGIANAWGRDPTAMANGSRALAEAFPNRFVLGVGVSHPETVRQRGHEFADPIGFMSRYIDGMEAAGYEAAAPEAPAPMILAAMGPRMLQLAAERADGAFPAPVTPAFTTEVREVLGPNATVVVGKYLAPGLARDEARRIFASTMGFYRSLDIYRAHFARLGWNEAQFKEGDPADLIDEIVSAGDEVEIRRGIREQFQAGADHVVAVLHGVDPEPHGLELLARSIDDV